MVRTNAILGVQLRWKMQTTARGTFGMLQFLLRQPLAILTALAVISLLSDIVSIQKNVMQVWVAFQTVTHWLWHHALSFLPLGNVPGWLKDYLSLGFITSGAVLRSDIAMDNCLREKKRLILLTELRRGGAIWRDDAPPIVVEHRSWIVFAATISLLLVKSLFV